MAAVLASVKLLRDQSSVPAHEGIGCSESGELFEAFTTKRVGQRSKSAAFGIGEAEPSVAKLSFENAIFLK